MTPTEIWSCTSAEMLDEKKPPEGGLKDGCKLDRDRNKRVFNFWGIDERVFDL